MGATVYLGVAVVATLLALLRLVAWTATGLILGAERYRGDLAVRTALAVLVGASLTMLIYALLASAGMIAAGIGLDALAAAGAMMWRGGKAVSSLRRTFQLLLPRTAAGRALFAAVMLLVWIVAIGPPRDGDVMHYHLAHIRQIIAAGIWQQLPICSYGIPFGWSLTYLPFEWMGLAQGGQLLNTVAWLLTCSVCIEVVGTGEALQNERLRITARWILLGTTLLPVVLKSATTAMADAFLILDVALVLALLVRLHGEGRGAAAALGFAAFVGWTTRYQAAAVSIAVTVSVVFDAFRRPESRRGLPMFGLGALVALIPAVPFYVANQLTLGSAIWPFGASILGGLTPHAPLGGGAAEQLAALCTAAATANRSQTLLASAMHLLTDRTAFPIPLVVAAGSAAVILMRASRLRTVAAFSLLFVGVWAIAQPSLAPRFAVYLTPVAVLCSAPLVAKLLVTRGAPFIRVVGGVALCGLGTVAVAYSRDYLRLAVSGNVARFHHATWYWPAYDWANRNTPPTARFVVALYGGDTYPLHRWNVSADPGSSAVIPWKSIASKCALADALAGHRADFLFYGPNVWTGRPMDARIEQLVRSATQAGILDTVRVFDVPIVYGRMEGLERATRVVLYRVDAAAIASGCP